MSNNSISVKEIINRLKISLSVKTDDELASIMGIARPTISNWKQRNSIDFMLLFELFKDLDLNYIIYGNSLNCKEQKEAAKENNQEAKVSNRVNQISVDKIKLYEMELSNYKEQITELKLLLSENKDIANSYKSQFLFQQEKSKQLEERLEAMQFSNTETVNDTLDKERPGHGSNRTLTIEKIKNRDTPAMV